MPDSTQARPTLSPDRDKIQSRVLIAVVLPVLIALFSFEISNLVRGGTAMLRLDAVVLIPSLTFAFLVWVLRAATFPAACTGGLITCILTGFTLNFHVNSFRTALTPLIALFILTFVATKAGKRRKQDANLSENPRGRNTAQVIANLGTPAILCIFLAVNINASYDIMCVAILAALAEATADTVSSEIGRAFGGTPILITTLRRVTPGTDGAITLLGTTAGIVAAAIVILTAFPAFHVHYKMIVMLTPHQALIALAAATIGLFVDTLLGATLERQALLNNDWVNFLSTASAALTAMLLL